MNGNFSYFLCCTSFYALQNYKLSVKENELVVGNLIVNKESSRVARLNVRETHRRKGIGSDLINHAFQKIGKLSVLNLDSSHSGLVNFFKYHEFNCYLQQYEMLKKYKH